MGSGGVFVSYRRADSAGSAHALHRELRRIERDHHGRLFLDIDNIDPGSDFREVIGATLLECAVVLVVIGPRWLTVTDNQGRRRIDSPSDTHRLEVAGALTSDAIVVPVLVEGADIPTPEDLPDDIEELAFKNAWILDERRFEANVRELADKINEISGRVQRQNETAAPPASEDAPRHADTRREPVEAEAFEPPQPRPEPTHEHPSEQDAAASAATTEQPPADRTEPQSRAVPIFLYWVPIAVFLIWWVFGVDQRIEDTVPIPDGLYEVWRYEWFRRLVAPALIAAVSIAIGRRLRSQSTR